MEHWYCGRRPVLEILNSEQAVEKLMLSKSADESFARMVLDLARRKNILVERVDKPAFRSLSNANHQGVAIKVAGALVCDWKEFIRKVLVQERPFICLCDEVQDPHNLGNILRSAVCLGAGGAVLPKWRSARITESVMRSSSGALTHLPVTEISNLTVALERLKDLGFRIYGSDLEGTPLPQTQFDFPLALVIGNEHKGVKPTLKKQCDVLVRIPQEKNVASLNAGAAAAILLYEIARAQKI